MAAMDADGLAYESERPVLAFGLAGNPAGSEADERCNIRILSRAKNLLLNSRRRTAGCCFSGGCTASRYAAGAPNHLVSASASPSWP